ncbi:LacI family DNA-binding transcriptional regulator [uncultured Sphaerochaeta sp.]|uniref:LacI family DNA-binding transcriptional regulator n=1 Tax=uncultured Sphaerochaeta sp. TaxID=886478 RepID=UPI002A0A46DD|nr:LacI family DNA-binding transcriptional regulator [uncultured Sphaerochaeta sp.]
MVTIKEISRLANVSPATVSRVLNRDDSLSVSKEVRNRIFSIATDLHYIPPRMRYTGRGERLVIGIADWHIIRPECENIKLSSLESLTRTLEIEDHVDFIRIGEENETSLDGIIAFGSFTEQEIENLTRQSFNLVFINDGKDGYRFDRITVDFEAGFHQAFAYLLQQGLTDIGYLGGLYNSNGIVIGQHRSECFCSLAKEANIFNDAFYFQGEMSVEAGKAMMEKMLALPTPPQAVLLSSDEIATGALQVLEKANSTMQNTLKVILYKDIATIVDDDHRYPTIRMYTDLVWETAIRMLFEQIHQKRSEALSVFIPARFEP